MLVLQVIVLHRTGCDCHIAVFCSLQIVFLSQMASQRDSTSQYADLFKEKLTQQVSSLSEEIAALNQQLEEKDANTAQLQLQLGEFHGHFYRDTCLVSVAAFSGCVEVWGVLDKWLEPRPNVRLLVSRSTYTDITTWTQTTEAGAHRVRVVGRSQM